MKKLVTLFVFLSQLCISFAQEFQFQMFFEDAIGNKDTLTLGYDPGATEGIDTLFGEKNLINVPFDSEFDVRITDFETDNNTYHTKKEIIGASCDTSILDLIRAIELDIKCRHWPITISWDSALFGSPCRGNSLVAPYIPESWFDVPNSYGFPAFGRLYGSSQVIFATPPDDVLLSDYGYITPADDSIYLFWTILAGDEWLVTIDEIQQEEIRSYPNPVNDFYYVDVQNESDLQLSVVDISGKSYPVEYSNGSVDLRDLPKGFYILNITLGNGEVVTKKIMKE